MIDAWNSRLSDADAWYIRRLNQANVDGLPTVTIQHRIERLVPRYEYQRYSIWGITAAMLVTLVNLALAADIELADYWKGEGE